MANSMVTAKTVAARALPHLIEKIQMLPLVQNGVYDEAFTHKVGDTIQIRKPVRGETVDGSGDISGSLQDIKDTAVEMTLNNQRTYAVAATSKEQQLNIDDFERQVIIPAVTTLAEDINQSLIDLGNDIPYFTGTAGTTPSTVKSIATGRKNLQDNKAPKDNRSYVFGSDEEVEYLSLDALVEVDKSGSTAALRDATIGRVYDLNMVSDTMIGVHTAGTFTAVTTPLVDGAVAAGATSIHLDGGAGTETILKGDLFTIGDIQYVATADGVAVSGDIDISIYPETPAIIADNAAVVFVDKTSKAHVKNLMFQKDAFAFAMAPLPEQPGADNATISYGGFSIRVVSDYDFANDKAMWRFDVLYGTKTTYAELATIILG